MELTELTLTQAAELIRQGAISPVELTRAHLARIERLDPQLNCFITVAAELALQRAREAEEALQRGEDHGPLHGIPIALKDLFETRGVRTTAGSQMLADYVPAADSAVAERLNTAGAILLGKLNMHEWAMSITTNNPFFGACKNPWAPERIPGGSSGGSGAALAAKLCLGSIGSDSAGSIRIPAALCGVAGLKPTYGRVSMRGAIPLSWSLDHAGPMARQVRDIALLLQTIAGYDPADPACKDVPVDDYLAHLDAGVRGWRVALCYEGFLSPTKRVDEEVQRAVDQAARIFEQLGAQVSEVSLPGAYEAQQMTTLIIRSEGAAYHRQRLQERPEDFGADVLAALRRGQAHTAVDYALARRTQLLLRRQIAQLFQNYDLLLTPTTPAAAPLREEPDDQRKTRASLVSFTAPFNLASLPALSVPCGLTTDNLPIGLQLAGRPWAEAQVLRAGYAYEQATEWHRRHPAL